MENKEINKECLEFIAFLKDENTKEFSGNIRVKKEHMKIILTLIF